MKRKLLFLSVFCFTVAGLYAQTAVNSDGSQADATAMLDVKSTVKGILLPRMTSAQRNAISSPANSLMLYDITLNKYYLYTKATWVKFHTSEMAIDDLFDAASDVKSVFFGSNAGNADDGNNYNTALGFNSLTANVSGSFNNAFGFKSLYNTTSGNNMAFGSFGLFSNTTGSGNIAVGDSAGYYIQEGAQNVLLGFAAGKGTVLQNISGNVFIGYKAGCNETGSNKLYISNSETSSPLIYGEFDNILLHINGTLNINSAYSFPNSGGSVGQILVTDGSGTVSWTNKPVTEINGLSDGKTIGNSVFLGQQSGNGNSGTGNKNTGLGYQALKSNTAGINNTVCGYNALYGANSDTANVAIGLNALGSCTGNKNTGIGIATLNSTDVDSNTAIGAYALMNNDTGEKNTAIGKFALNNLESGNNNVAVGINAGYGIQEGSENTIIGAYSSTPSSDYNISGSVFIGNMAGFDERNSNRLYIDNSGTSNPLIYGEFNNDYLRIGGTLDIKDNYTFPTSDGTNRQVLQTDGSGNIEWNANVEINDLKNGKTSVSGLYLGWDAGKNVSLTGDKNTAIGDSALLSITQTNGNTAAGYHALRNLYNTSSGPVWGSNVAIGYKSMDSVEWDFRYNIAVGAQTMSVCPNDYGYDIWDNIAIGYHTLYRVSANYNIAIGYESMGLNSNAVASGNNIAVGTFSLYRLTDGTNNIALGDNALYNVSSGEKNVGVGSFALYDITTGNYNTAAGKDAGPATSDFVYTGSFGYNAKPLAGSRIKFGDNIHVNWIGGNSAWHNTSDGRFKKDIKEDVPGIEFIMKLRPVTFRFDNYALEKFTGTPGSQSDIDDETGKELAEKNMKTVHTGFIAQEVEKAALETSFDFDAVSHPENDHDVYSLAYAEFVVPLVKSVQEQHLIIVNQKRTLQNQAKQISELEKRILDNAKIIEKIISEKN